MLLPGLSLEHQTLTSNDLQDASTFNFKITELQGKAGIQNQWDQNFISSLLSLDPTEIR